MDKSGQIEEAGEEVKEERQERKPTRSRERSTPIEDSQPKEVIHTVLIIIIIMGDQYFMGCGD